MHSLRCGDAQSTMNGPDPSSTGPSTPAPANGRKGRLRVLPSTAPPTLMPPDGTAPTPTYAVWELTLKCDHACNHCGSRAGHARDDELGTEDCLRIVDQMANLGIREVTLIGGEPYLRDDWLQIVRAIRNRTMIPNMTTGGRGLTFERAVAARQAGLRAVSVSIDGLETAHDRLRNVRGSFRSAMQALDNARRAGLRIACNSQLNRLSMPDLPGLAEALIATGVRAWQLALTAPMGRAADNVDFILQPYELLTLFPILAQVKSRCDEAGLSFWPANNVGYFGPYAGHLRSRSPGGHSKGCHAGKGSIGIEADGTLKGCPSLPTDAYGAGNLREYGLLELWERSKRLRYTRERTVDDLEGFCRTCYYAEVCMAGCTWTTHVVMGRPGNNPYCYHRALTLDDRGQRERLVRVETAPQRPFDHGRFNLILEPKEK